MADEQVLVFLAPFIKAIFLSILRYYKDDNLDVDKIRQNWNQFIEIQLYIVIAFIILYVINIMRNCCCKIESRKCCCLPFIVVGVYSVSSVSLVRPQWQMYEAHRNNADERPTSMYLILADIITLILLFWAIITLRFCKNRQENNNTNNKLEVQENKGLPFPTQDHLYITVMPN